MNKKSNHSANQNFVFKFQSAICDYPDNVISFPFHLKRYGSTDKSALRFHASLLPPPRLAPSSVLLAMCAYLPSAPMRCHAT